MIRGKAWPGSYFDPSDHDIVVDIGDGVAGEVADDGDGIAASHTEHQIVSVGALADGGEAGEVIAADIDDIVFGGAIVGEIGNADIPSRG